MSELPEGSAEHEASALPAERPRREEGAKDPVFSNVSVHEHPNVYVQHHAASHAHPHVDPGTYAHGHAHVRGHADDGEHGHVHGEAVSPHRESPEPYEEERERPPLARSREAGRLLFLDLHSGVAGDMTIAALVDLGVPFALIQGLPELLGLQGVAVRVERVYRQSIKACRFCVDVQAPQPARTFAAIETLLDQAALDPKVREMSQRIFETLARAEAEVHGVKLRDVHLHEVGAADALIDIVGAATCLEYLGARVMASPVPLGRGFISCAHGHFPAPAPATVLCLRGVPTYDGGLDTEFVTPTGAAIVATVSEQFVRWPSLVVERVGWGAGTRLLADRPNALRVVFGSEPEAKARSHVVLECNVDDMPGELAGHALSQLLAAGALDVWAVPCVMKKGRPGLTISALCDAAEQHLIASVMLKETSSIGLRYYPMGRIERPRRFEQVDTRFGVVRVKISGGPFGPALAKPEFDECARLAAEHGVPVRLVLEAAQSAAADLIAR